MILERTIAPVFAANCYVLAPAPGGPARARPAYLCVGEQRCCAAHACVF